MPKPKRLYHTGAIVPNDYDFEKNERLLLMVCIPKSTLWVAMYKGLLSLPCNYWFWRLDSTIAHKSVKLAKDVFHRGIYMTCLNDLNYNLQEMNFTLKRIENSLCDNKTISTFGQQPTIARNEDGTIDTNTNNSVTNTSMSNFEVGSLLENNSITDVLKIALLDDGTIGFPDVNPFNLESKLDDIRTDINETKVHFTNNFTDLMNYFASSFREQTWSPLSILNNPYTNQSIYQMLLDTFNDTEKTYTTVYIPFWGNTSIPIWTKNHSLIYKFNQNFSNTFNEQFNENTDLASNSYFRNLHYWLTTDWKLFEDIMSTMRDCICLGRDLLEQINLSLWGDDSTNGLTHIKNSLSTINSTISGLELSPNNNITIDNCCEDTKTALDNISNAITNNNTNSIGDVIKDSFNNINNSINNINNSINHQTNVINNNNDNSTTTVVDNGDGTYTITCEDTTEPIREDVPLTDIEDVKTVSGEILQPTTIIKRNCKNALCGFTYFYLSGLADFIEAIGNLLDPLRYIFYFLSSFKATDTVLKSAEIATILPGGVILSKLPISKATSVVSGYFVLEVSLELAPTILRAMATEYACGANGLRPITEKSSFIDTVIQSASTLGLGTEINYLGYLAGIFWDYSNSLTDTSFNVDMNDYIQYCPCIDPTACLCQPPFDGYEIADQNIVISEALPPLQGSQYYQYVVNVVVPTDNKTCVSGLYLQWSSDGIEWNGFRDSLPIDISASDEKCCRLALEGYIINNGSVTLSIGSIRRWGQVGNFLRIKSIFLGEDI